MNVEVLLLRLDESSLDRCFLQQIDPKDDIDLLLGVQGKIMGNTICALGDAAAMPVESFLRNFREEFEYYIEHGKSMVKG